MSPIYLIVPAKFSLVTLFHILQSLTLYKLVHRYFHTPAPPKKMESLKLEIMVKSISQHEHKTES